MRREHSYLGSRLRQRSLEAAQIIFIPSDSSRFGPNNRWRGLQVDWRARLVRFGRLDI
jgi:hypothetical protein